MPRAPSARILDRSRQTMKAAVYYETGKPEVLRYEDVPDPPLHPKGVLIQAGGGGVGLAAIQLAKRAGATVLATASSDDKLRRLEEFGLDHGINYRERDFVDEARKITNGRGVDLVVDSVGGSTLQGSL